MQCGAATVLLLLLCTASSSSTIYVNVGLVMMVVKLRLAKNAIFHVIRVHRPPVKPSCQEFRV
jgi:hypothetical protein